MLYGISVYIWSKCLKRRFCNFDLMSSSNPTNTRNEPPKPKSGFPRSLSGSQKESHPKIADIKQLLESNEIPEAISTAKSMIEPILLEDPENYSDETQAFIDTALPYIFKDLFNLDKQPRRIVDIIVEFIDNYVSLIVKLNLHELMLKTFCECVHNYEKDIKTFTPIQLSEEEKLLIIKSFTDKETNVLRDENTSDISQLVGNTIRICFSSGLFTKTIDLISNKTITNTQLSLVFKLFCSIEGYLVEDIIFLLLPIFADAAINKLKTLNEDFDGVTQMLTSFIDMLPEKSDDILQILCNLVFSGPVDKRYTTIDGIKSIVIERKNLSKKNLTLVKKALLTGLFEFSNDQLINQVLDFLPTLSSKTIFSDEDLGDILTKVQSAPITQRCQCITKLIPNMDSSLKKFAKFFLESDIYSPELICLLIGRTNNNSLNRSLFEYLLKPPETTSTFSLSSLSVSDRMMNLIKDSMDDTEDPEIICSLSRILQNCESPPNNIDQFIDKVITFSEANESMIPILLSFSSILTSFDSKNTVATLFNIAYNHFVNGDNNHYLNLITPVLTEWISASSSIAEDQIYRRLLEYSFSKMPVQMAPLISNIIKKTKKNSILKEFLLKLINDTVPPKFSAWAIKNVFQYLHNDKKAMANIVQTLIGHLQDDEKRNNALHLIKRAAQYEADFFRLGEEYSNVFHVAITGSMNINFRCSLHPYHTCRRVYAEVIKLLRTQVDKFQLAVTDKSHDTDRLIISSTPISEIVEQSISKIRLTIQITETGVTDFHVEPIFLSLLYDDSDSIHALYDLLSNEDELSPIVLEILQLFEPFIGFDVTSPLQKVLLKCYERPLDFADNPRLFPLALASFQETSMNVEDFSKVISIVINGSFDKLSAAIMSKAITRIECPDFLFTPELIKKGLITNKHKSLRVALLKHFNSSNMTNASDEIISLIPMVTRSSYREFSKEFLMCFNECNLPKESFIPFYKDLEQYETVNIVDQTFVSLLKLIPKNAETVKLTYERVAVAPTVKNPQNPFVHSEKARGAAFEFLNTDQVYPLLLAHLKNIPEVPSILQKLSDDFTFKGRNGISNLGSTCYINTLLQSLNTVSNVINRILSLPTEGLSKYLYELRDFMAQLRYSRNMAVSIKPLVETNPDFDAFLQEDTEEFLGYLINRIFEELKDDAVSLKDELEITIQASICNDEKVFNTNNDTLIVLSLPTKNLSNLFEAFHKSFEDEPIDYLDEETKQRVSAVRRYRISKWPNYLFIQLQRWDFKFGYNGRIKLVHEFGFPMEFNTDDIPYNSDKMKNIKYQLSAVIVHEGDVESGHYFAIVNGDDGEWYICDDIDIQSFDVSNIPAWSFGNSKNEPKEINTICTAYLLFYRRVDIQVIEPKVPADLEERINKYNETTWPSTFFYSKQFLEFARNLTSSFPGDDATEVALTVLFRIAIVNEPTARQWQEHVQQNFLTTPQQSNKFFMFIKNVIGKSLGQLINHSDFSCESLKSVIFKAFGLLPNTTEPLVIVLDAIDFSLHKRSFTLAFELISLAYQDLNVSWKDEEDVLKIMVRYITNDMTREFVRTLKAPLAEAAELLVKILSNVVLKKGAIEPVSLLFQKDVLERLSSILRHSESFQKLAINARSLQPALVSSIGDTKASVNSLLAPLSYVQTPSEKNSQIIINTSFIGDILEKLVFSSNQTIRRNICNILCEVMDNPDPVVENYINNRVFENDLICPSVIEESTFLDMLTSLLPIGLQNLEYFDCYADVLVKLCLAAPFATSLSFASIIEAVPQIRDQELLIKFLIAVKHLVAFDDSLRDQVSPQIVETFLSLEFGQEEALQFVALFPQNASGSTLFASCISEALECSFSDISMKIISMVKDGMDPGNFTVPEIAKDPMNIQIAAALFECSEKHDDDLKNYILSILMHLKPIEAFSIEPFSSAIQMIERHYQRKIEELMQ
ncbi:hypothetical protein TRFO_25460 [Tritrichomonas foetus]|uniref:USP domain-containing protein n=1 Tax=Tritrichomonas foetus TaxID=1144522 RepID=A0A1J4K695_9EUKA|nr:hypothetical protein TRFO_25460 [Tritrichomonas foetus]|eukprot:OHT06506.1 hypothetical protein TRFO_25460 [Tritrichomonas foetus]